MSMSSLTKMTIGHHSGISLTKETKIQIVVQRILALEKIHK